MAQTIPSKDADFNEWQKNLIATVEDNLEKWGIPENWFKGKVLKAKKNWEEALAQCSNHMQRTQLMTSRKHRAKKEYLLLLRKLIEMMRGLPEVTDGDLERVSISVRKGRGNKLNTAPDDYPFFWTDLTMLRRVWIRFRRQGSKLRGKPHGVRCAEIE
jgi:hypothetical protein